MTGTVAERVSHTPGPWKVFRCGDQFEVFADANNVCCIHQWAPNVDEADANLIAAAPELLAAAKKVCAEAGPDMSPSLGSLAKLDAAIAKAEGRDV